MKKINWRNLMLLLIDFLLVGYITGTITKTMNGMFLGLDGLLLILLATLIMEIVTEELIRLLNK